MMTAAQEDLWQRIKNFEIDDPEAALTFTERLARENGWSLEFAVRAVDEYKKFMFLLCIAPHPLTPSDQVDQVWHLHLLYTESYWEEFCHNVLQRKIHHGPTKGGKSEHDKYSDWYAKTKSLYAEVFGAHPPGDLWPSSEIRFGETNFMRINLDRNLVIKKIRFRK
jgi:hypothetical protein